MPVNGQRAVDAGGSGEPVPGGPEEDNCQDRDLNKEWAGGL